MLFRSVRICLKPNTAYYTTLPVPRKPELSHAAIIMLTAHFLPRRRRCIRIPCRRFCDVTNDRSGIVRFDHNSSGRDTPHLSRGVRFRFGLVWS